MLNSLLGLYKPDSASFFAWPILHPGGHSNLPSTYFQICGMDPLRDEWLNICFASVVSKQTYIYKGLPYAFWVIFPHLEATRRQEADTMAFRKSGQEGVISVLLMINLRDSKWNLYILPAIYHSNSQLPYLLVNTGASLL